MTLSDLKGFLPKKRVLSSDPEDTDWDIRTCEWNDAIDACAEKPLPLAEILSVAKERSKKEGL